MCGAEAGIGLGSGYRNQVDQMQRSEDGLLFGRRNSLYGLLNALECWCLSVLEKQARGQEPLNKGPHTWQGFSRVYLL